MAKMARPDKPKTMKQWEKSPMDDKKDKKYKEGSVKDKAADRKALNAYNKKIAR